MGSSGLIYAAIVAGWAAFLVPRWVRRNEEIDQAREADAARGTRILGQSASQARSARTQARHEPLPVIPAEPADLVNDTADIGEYGQAAGRRRRVLFVLVLAFVVATVVAVIGTLPLWSVAIPTVLLFGFLQLARRAAEAEANRPQARRRRAAETTFVPHTARQRIAVLDEPGPAERVDPHAWEPVPVPLPTYLTKDIAPDDTATRTIDLTQPGAWTAGRLESARSNTFPRPSSVPQSIDEDGEQLPEHRPAVGD
jgi:hypothetical protein